MFDVAIFTDSTPRNHCMVRADSSFRAHHQVLPQPTNTPSWPRV